MLLNTHGPNAPGIYYAYKNEPKHTNIVSDKLPQVFDRINGEIEEKGDALSSIIKGNDALWDVSIMKFIYDLTRRSVQDNVNQFGARGLLNVDTWEEQVTRRSQIARRAAFRENRSRRRETPDTEGRAQPLGPFRRVRRPVLQIIPEKIALNF